MIAHGLVHGHPAENSTAIVHGKWPLNPVMQRMVYSELLSSLLYQKRLATLQLHSLIIPLSWIKSTTIACGNTPRGETADVN
jgi:hypothetical protein